MKPPILERAYAIARSGEVNGVRELEQRLKHEGYERVRVQLEGRSLRRELGLISRAAFQAREL